MLGNSKLRQRIEAILAEFPHCRDDDQRLLANVWQAEYIEKYGIEAYNGAKFHSGLGEVAKGVLSNPESIRRTRQLIQEKQPLLRGEKYRARQKHEGVVKQEIRAFK